MSILISLVSYDSSTLSRYMETRGPSSHTTPAKNSSPFHAPYTPTGPFYPSGSRPAVGAPAPTKYTSGLTGKPYQFVYHASLTRNRTKVETLSLLSHRPSR